MIDSNCKMILNMDSDKFNVMKRIICALEVHYMGFDMIDDLYEELGILSPKAKMVDAAMYGHHMYVNHLVLKYKEGLLDMKPESIN